MSADKPNQSQLQESDFIQLSAIDRSVRTAGLFFLFSAVAWLLIGTVFAIIASYKMHTPSFLAEIESFTFGRVRSAHLNSVIFGWSSNVIYGIGIWIMARLCRTEIQHGGMLVLAGVLWNVSVLIGIIGILTGSMTSLEWLEMPLGVLPVLGFSYILIAIWAVMAFFNRKSEKVFISQWYLLAAFLWFPWLYVVAAVMLLYLPARGIVQPITNWWFAQNVYTLFMAPVALGVAYYLIPKVLGKAVYSYYLALLGFWTLALFGSWSCLYHLQGGPIPVWLQSIATMGSIVMLLPIVIVAINLHMTVYGSFAEVWKSPTLRFIVFGAIAYTVTGVVNAVMSLKTISEILHFTHFHIAHAHNGVYAFFTMIMFGAVYFALPRMIKKEWPSATLIWVHFWSCALGAIAFVLGLSIGGVIQGIEMNMSETPFLELMSNTLPYLASRTVSGILMTIGHCAFLINVVWIIMSPKADDAGPTLFIENETNA